MAIADTATLAILVSATSLSCHGLLVSAFLVPSLMTGSGSEGTLALNSRRTRGRSSPHTYSAGMENNNEGDNDASTWIVSSLKTRDDDTGEEETSGLPPNFPRIPTRLILHLDINETILLGDDAGGDSRHDSIQKMIAKSAFCQIPSKAVPNVGPGDPPTQWETTQQMEPTHWWDGQPFGEERTMPPLYTGWQWPEYCCPYYRTAYKKYSKRFVDDHEGSIYRPILDACEVALAKAHSDHILPAFFRTLHHLIQQQQQTQSRNDGSPPLPFTVVFRTFGSDVEEISKLVTEFSRGKHPDYPEVNYPPLGFPPDRLYQGRWKEVSTDNAGGTMVIYQLWNQDESELVASGDEEILALLRSVPVCGVRDDYPYWKANHFEPTAGKPVWVPKYDGATETYDHHVLFDDNIHNLPHDGIACVREQVGGGSFETADGATMHRDYQGIHLIRVPTIEPVLCPDWFIRQIEKASNKLQRRLYNVRNKGN